MTAPPAWRFAAQLAALVILTAVAGCGAKAHGSPATILDTPSTAFRGTPLPRPVPMPDVTLIETSGQPYPLRTRTAGHLTLLYLTAVPDGRVSREPRDAISP